MRHTVHHMTKKFGHVMMMIENLKNNFTKYFGDKVRLAG